MSEALKSLLGPMGTIPQIGPETERRDLGDVKIYESSAKDSYRYLRLDGQEPIAVLQIVTQDGITGRIANVYVKPEWRRKKVATELLQYAEWDFITILAAKHLSPEGQAWSDSHGLKVDP